MKIRAKIIALGAGTGVAVGLTLGAYMLKISADASERRIAELESTVRENFDMNARLEVQTAISMLKPFAERAERGELPLAQAKKDAADLLRNIRYGKEGYFWVDTYDGVSVVLPGRPQTEGKNRLEDVDAKGYKVVRGHLAAGRSPGGGFNNYYVVKQGGTVPLPKRSYLAEFTPFQWVVGSGNYIDDIDALVAAERLKADHERRAQYGAIGLIVLVTAALSSLLAFLLGRSVTRPLATMVGEAAKLRQAVDDGELDVRGAADRIDPEFRPVVEGMNATLDAFVAPFRLAADHVHRIARGDLPPRIDAEYRGEFGAIKESLDTCVAAIEALVADAVLLSSSALDGKLAVRADPSRHQGDFRKIVEGFDRTLDAVMKPVDDATEVLERVARRDLRARVLGSYRGDHAKIANAVNGAAAALHDALSEVARAAGEVSSASGVIASSSEAVASGASEQASALEETSSSLTSMSSMTRHAADHAQEASALAAAARGAATAGSAAMDEMSGAMARIKSSAEGTSQIIKDINEIAFQTNLLALNAAVEAARAGEAGRGFAVVAEEVRSLALRSKEAANRTEDLIRQSVKEAGAGEQTSRDVGAKLAGIVDGISKVTAIVAEISASAREQSTGLEQITRAVTQVGQVTQQNAASSEESSSTAANLAEQAQRLAVIIDSFQLDAGPTVEGRPPALDGTSRPRLLTA